jgi:hypothetical protein
MSDVSSLMETAAATSTGVVDVNDDSTSAVKLVANIIDVGTSDAKLPVIGVVAAADTSGDPAPAALANATTATIDNVNVDDDADPEVDVNVVVDADVNDDAKVDVADDKGDVVDDGLQLLGSRAANENEFASLMTAQANAAVAW